MRPMLYTFFMLLWFNLNAQITVTNVTFPDVGDTLFYATDDMPVGLNLGGNGGPKSWDFSALLVADENFTVYLDASTGQNFSSFPTADLVTISANGAESYYRRTNSEFSLLGYVGANANAFGLEIVARFNPPFVLRRSPMQFFDINQAESDLSLPFSIAALPDSIIPGIPGVDSFRVRIHTERLDVVDSYGDLSLPQASYAVLREKRTEYTETKIDIHSFLGWSDVSGLFGGMGAGIDTSISYHYVANTQKGDVAVVDVSNDGLAEESVRYSHRPQSTPSKEPLITAPGQASIQAYPNPAFEDVSFECKNLPRDIYTLKVFNLLGLPVHEETRELAGNTKIVVDLEDIDKGTYLYSLTAENGRKIGTKRLVVIKP